MKRGVKSGTPSGVEISPERRRRKAAARRREERRWALKSGPVTVRFACPICGGSHAKADHQEKTA